MKYTATTIVELTIQDSVYRLTREQAEMVYNALGNALGKTASIQYPTGVRGVGKDVPVDWEYPYKITGSEM
jgi:hypothetical protein